VWAATGPALEAYSKYPFVKKANEPGETMKVSEFLRAVRRIVVEFVVGRVLGEATHGAAPDASTEVAASLDDVTTYYLLHRHDFRLNDAPAGACILYALSCNLSEGELADRYGILTRTGGVEADEDDEAEESDADVEDEPTEGSGSSFKLKAWKQRRRPGLGLDPVSEKARARRDLQDALGPGLFDEGDKHADPLPRSRVVPLIDMVHHVMHLWVDGDVNLVNQYVDDQGLRRSEVFRQLLQALIELSETASEERSVLERISNHLQARGVAPESLLDKTL
jgi:hypothetical protein